MHQGLRPWKEIFLRSWLPLASSASLQRDTGTAARALWCRGRHCQTGRHVPCGVTHVQPHSSRAGAAQHINHPCRSLLPAAGCQDVLHGSVVCRALVPVAVQQPLVGIKDEQAALRDTGQMTTAAPGSKEGMRCCRRSSAARDSCQTRLHTQPAAAGCCRRQAGGSCMSAVHLLQGHLVAALGPLGDEQVRVVVLGRLLQGADALPRDALCQARTCSSAAGFGTIQGWPAGADRVCRIVTRVARRAHGQLTGSAVHGAG